MMDFLTSYRPTDTDKRFARWVVSSIKDGGIWALPINGAAFRISHNAGGGGRLVLLDGHCDDELFARTAAVFKCVGYSVVKADAGKSL